MSGRDTLSFTEQAGVDVLDGHVGVRASMQRLCMLGTQERIVLQDEQRFDDLLTLLMSGHERAKVLGEHVVIDGQGSGLDRTDMRERSVGKRERCGVRASEERRVSRPARPLPEAHRALAPTGWTSDLCG